MQRGPVGAFAEPHGVTVGRSWLEDPPLFDKARPHCMRVMLVTNTDVEHGHAHGATGRLVSWSPEVSIDGTRVRSGRVSDPGVQARF